MEELIESLRGFMSEALGLVVLVTVLVFVDLRFGVRSAKKRGEKIRLSGAMRRTFSKLVDYYCWVLLAIMLGVSIGSRFGLSFVPAMIMIYAIALELDSIGSHWAELHGVPLKDKKGKPVSFLKYFILMILGKTGEALGADKKEDEESRR